MKLVVGLGNPGRRYVGTRHNIGFMVLAELARRYGAGSPKKKFQAEVVDIDLDGEKTLLVSPTTYMNLSGASVLAARDFYRVPLEDVLVICDDMNLPVATLRVRAGGSAGGQKGLADIIRRLGDEQVPRLRVGIGSPPQGRAGTDYVLARFSAEELGEMEKAIARAADAAVVWAREGIHRCMNQYN